MDGACTACGHLSRIGVRFCTGCGASLAPLCPSCAVPAESGERFCGHCGAALQLGAPILPPAARIPPALRTESERKQVTVLFADVAGSMELAERLDADEWTQIMKRLFAIFRDAITHFGGTVDKFTGDGAMALFGAPVAQEDHARRACHAALNLVGATSGYAFELRQQLGIDLNVRVGLNSGEVVAGSVSADGSAYTAVGHTVGLAQRMESIAKPGIAYLSEHTAAAESFLLRGLGKIDVKGSTVPLGVFALEGASGSSSAAGRRRSGSARLVGRERELATLQESLAEARDGRAQVVGLVGEAGAGKSRLCEELAQRAIAAGVLVRRTAGVSHAQTVPLLPILGLFRDYFSVADEDTPAQVRAKVAARMLALDADLEPELALIFDFLEVPDPDRPSPQLSPEVRRRRVLDVIRRLSQRRSERQTLLLILEDLHWFDQQSVEFLDAWLPSFPGTRTLVITNFRPEFHAPWMARSYYRQLPLAPLDGSAVGELLGEILGPDPDMATVSRQLLARAAGNPFFAEELIRGLAGDGTLSGEPGAYELARPASEIRVPPTVQAVLAVRIDRLAGRDKSVLQAAAVIGRTFSAPILGTVASVGAELLSEILQSLSAAELLQSTGTDGEYRFWHPLTHEVAYGTLLGAARRRLHQRVAEALTATDPGRHDELAALVVTHFEAAGDDLEAARWQLRAGARATGKDWAEAAMRWRSAIEHLDAAPPTTETLRLRVKAQSWLLRFGGRTGMDAAELDRLSAEARAGAEDLQDPGLLGGLWISNGSARFLRGENASAAVSFAHGVRHTELAGDVGLHAWALCMRAAPWVIAGPLSDGIDTVERGIALCADQPARTIEQAGYSPHDFGHFVNTLLLVPAGRLGEARAGIERAAALFEQRPVTDWRSWTLARFAHLAQSTGELSDVEAAARAADEAVHIASDSGSIAILVAVLEGAGLVALLQGRPDEALSTFDRALAMAGPHGAGAVFAPSVLAHRALTQLALQVGAAARTDADAALALARRQGARVYECFAQLVRAQVYRETATSDADLAEASAAVVAGEALAAETGALTYAAFLAEERARLEPGPEAQRAGLKLAADAYTAIGATGHARRLREELAS